jgi:hypothetical protein
VFESQYQQFLKTVVNANFSDWIFKKNRYRFIILKGTTKYHQKQPDVFWHISSVEKTKCPGVVDVHLCVNTSYEKACVLFNSSFSRTIPNLGDRNPCVFRSSCSSYVETLITSLINNQLTGIRVWTETKKNDHRMYIRKEINNIDFLAIFNICSQRKNDTENYLIIPLILITAFPIEFISSKKQYERQWRANRLI